jgi:arylformamidase
MTAIYDMPLPVSASLVLWPQDPPVRMTYISHLDRGDDATVSELSLSAHTGTHIDAPLHYVQGGPGVDEIALDVLVGQALVVHALKVDALSVSVLESLEIPPGTERLLFRTRNSELWRRGEHAFDESYVALTEASAHWLVARCIRLVGVDYMSVAPYPDQGPVHRILLGGGVIPVEGLDLSGVPPGRYLLVCLPLKIVAGDGAPARAVLIDLHEA